MLKTPWRPSVDVNPLFRPFSPKPSDLMMRLAWANEEGCCVADRGQSHLLEENTPHHNTSRVSSRQCLTPTNLLEGISVGLQADFHHLEWIDNNRLGQACAKSCCRQCLVWGDGHELRQETDSRQTQQVVKRKTVCLRVHAVTTPIFIQVSFLKLNSLLSLKVTSMSTPPPRLFFCLLTNVFRRTWHLCLLWFEKTVRWQTPGENKDIRMWEKQKHSKKKKRSETTWPIVLAGPGNIQ